MLSCRFASSVRAPGFYIVVPLNDDFDFNMRDFWSECRIEFIVASLHAALQNAGPCPFCNFKDSSAFSFLTLILGKQIEIWSQPMFTVRLTIHGQAVLSESMFDSARACGGPDLPFVCVTSAKL